MRARRSHPTRLLIFPPGRRGMNSIRENVWQVQNAPELGGDLQVGEQSCFKVVTVPLKVLNFSGKESGQMFRSGPAAPDCAVNPVPCQGGIAAEDTGQDDLLNVGNKLKQTDSISRSAGDIILVEGVDQAAGGAAGGVGHR